MLQQCRAAASPSWRSFHHFLPLVHGALGGTLRSETRRQERPHVVTVGSQRTETKTWASGYFQSWSGTSSPGHPRSARLRDSQQDLGRICPRRGKQGSVASPTFEHFIYTHGKCPRMVRIGLLGSRTRGPATSGHPAISPVPIPSTEGQRPPSCVRTPPNLQPWSPCVSSRAPPPAPGGSKQPKHQPISSGQPLDTDWSWLGR